MGWTSVFFFVTQLVGNEVFEKHYTLGGGFKYFLFSSLFGEDSQCDEYFSKGLVQPPTSI